MDTQHHLLEFFKEKRLRLTKARKALAAIFASHKTPLPVSSLLGKMREAGAVVNKTTVYRELDLFQKMGIIEPVRLDGREQRFELSSLSHHHHLVCLKCEHVEEIDIDERQLILEEKKVGKKKRFTAVRHSLEFFGVCAGCRAS